jgi:hypothetical protein
MSQTQALRRLSKESLFWSDTMRQILFLFGLACALNGTVMMLAPTLWFGAISGVSETGPFNAHFVRDVGAAYVASGVGFLALSSKPQWWPAAVVGLVFLLAHGGIHVLEVIVGHHPPSALLRDAPAVLVGPLLGVWCVINTVRTLAVRDD